MRLLAVFPNYPGEPFDGAAVYERNLLHSLRSRGARIDVLSTRSLRPRHRGAFALEWPIDQARHDQHDGVGIRRYRAISAPRLASRCGFRVIRRLTREDVRRGEVASHSVAYLREHLYRADRRPARFDAMAALGLGPLMPALTARVLLWAWRYDAIIVGYLPFSLPGQVQWAARPSRTPVVLLPFLHEDDRYHLFRRSLSVCERASAVFTLSRHTVDVLAECAPRARAVALGAGVTVGDAVPDAAAVFRREHDLLAHRLLLFVGRREQSKRYDLAVDALARLPADVVLGFAGKNVDGVVFDHPRIRDFGVLSDVELAAAYAACDIFVLPSEHESFGMAFIDAWRHGKPVIGSAKCHAVSCLIDDGVDGYLCLGAAEIAERAGRLLSDPDLARRMGEAGRRRVLDEFTWDRVGERAMALLSTIIG